VDTWLERHQSLKREWRAIGVAEQAHGAAAIGKWQSRLGQMRGTQQALVEAGRWRGGPRTLLAAIDMQYRELAMTAGLAWLLRPDGHHGLGPAVLTGLCKQLGIAADGAGAGVRIALEDQRDETRADLVVYGADWTIVVEAKTFASEQKRQLDRLYDHWRREPGPCFVFLTRGERVPTTAVDSSGHWQELTWQQVAEVALAAANSMAGVAPGVHDYIATLEAYHRV